MSIIIGAITLNPSKKLSEKAINGIYKNLSYYYFYINYLELFNTAFIAKVFSLVKHKKSQYIKNLLSQYGLIYDIYI